ncbi:hypothetical protein K431DRAFT_286653 [Polychaeton citri CBS 116435]|uniref:FCP1 homology domain-containing protein n=1 Tax=Polychaeton citri CBS 116435 TaxID=1314669 RepID=A0A9P4Q578_9PEZI|nr:hypothetical protein K431DRAFT_286653 [Polychaeton citri CBS 116435]
MNSLNILSGLTSTPPPSPPRSRTSSTTNVHSSIGHDEHDHSKSDGLDFASLGEKIGDVRSSIEADEGDGSETADEKSPLLNEKGEETFQSNPADHSRSWTIHRRVKDAIVNGLNVVITAITAPGRYVIASFYDEEGHFSAIMPLRNLQALLSKRKRRHSIQPGGYGYNDGREAKSRRKASTQRSPSVDSVGSSTSVATSDGETENEGVAGSPARNTRSRTAATTKGGQDTTTSPKTTIKIKQNDEALKKRKSANAATARRRTQGSAGTDDMAAVANSLKSPTSAATAARMTRYPRTPRPPRPLVPRRQPSYAAPSFSPTAPRKTLVIDLDETLIHSMAKGGRMSTGHMVEVQLNAPMPAQPPSLYGQQPARPPVLGPGVPILYYVHERPGCHDFLRKVAKWYNLVIFTASVQEYADPVIDWLEREKKYFSGRYYRQHCIFRGGAYVKDLAQVEPDLSRVMILDNSPMSYVFHEDNAIPIEGWISDPTDSDLLHLVPLLEGLQYVTDVRALLALRQGQAQQA